MLSLIFEGGKEKFTLSFALVLFVFAQFPEQAFHFRKDNGSTSFSVEQQWSLC